jgi:hypothetical protein
MAALSTKAQRDQILLVDTFTLTPAEQQLCVKQMLQDVAGNLKELNKYFLSKRLIRERVYRATDGDESLYQDEKGNLLPDEAVVANVMERLLENRTPLAPLYMNTCMCLLSSSAH